MSPTLQINTIPSMSDADLAAAAVTLRRTLDCPRLQGAFLDARVLKGDLSWTRPRLRSAIRKFMAVIVEQQALRKLAA